MVSNSIVTIMCDFFPDFVCAITASYLVDDICGDELRKMCNGIIIKDMRNGDTYKNGVLQSFDGEPARIRDTFKEWYKDGKKHNEDFPAKIEINAEGRLTEYYFTNGVLHRDDGPAFIEYCIKEEYYNEYYYEYFSKEGIRKNISSIDRRQFNLYTEIWFRNGSKHRDDGPAKTHWRADGPLFMQVWYQNGMKHRGNDEPSNIEYYPNGSLYIEMWNSNGKCHREGDLPSFIMYSPEGEPILRKWYIDGVCMKVIQV